jgi:hypothetical protein
MVFEVDLDMNDLIKFSLALLKEEKGKGGLHQVCGLLLARPIDKHQDSDFFSSAIDFTYRTISLLCVMYIQLYLLKVLTCDARN